MATYIAPGVTVTETTSASFTPIAGEPTTLCLIGPSQGFQNATEVTTLSDQAAYTLQVPYANPATIRVVDASNPSTVVFASNLVNPTTPDFTIDTSQQANGTISISRSMPTRITNGQTVVTYLENGDSTGHSGTFPLSGISQSAALSTVGATSGLVANTISIQNPGVVSSGDYTISGSSITRTVGASTLQKYQTIYVTYTHSNATVTDQPFQLNYSSGANAAATPLNSGPAFPSTGTTNVVIRNAPGATGTAFAYTAGTTTDGDYIVTGSGASATVARSAGTSTIGSATNPDALQVIITYQATPINYCLPTRVFSTADAEAKYGAAFDANGNISSPLSFGAYLAFLAGAPNVVLQPLFASEVGDPYEPPTGEIGDWENTLEQLEAIPSINLIVPIYSANGLSVGDSAASAIQAAVANFITTQNDVNERIVALFGEDSTTGSYGSKATLRGHAETLSSNGLYERLNLISPANFNVVNPITNTSLSIGGQYAACSVAGWLASHPIQQEATRKVIPGLTFVNELRAPRDKDADAQSGLMVLENTGTSSVRIRDAITVAQGLPNSTVAQQRLNVVRSKLYVMDTVQTTLDDQVVGNVEQDENGPFIVQTLVTTTLADLQDSGVITAYGAVQVAPNATNPGLLQVQFLYEPAYYVIHIAVNFSVSLTGLSGVSAITSTTLTTAF